MAEALYSLDVLRLAASVSRWPALAAADGSAERRSATCGSRVRVDVTLDAGGRVSAIGLAVSACALGQASAAIMAGHAVGQGEAALRTAHAALADYLAGRRDALPDWPGMERLAAARAYPARHPSILLAFDAAATAVALAGSAAGAPDDRPGRRHG